MTQTKPPIKKVGKASPGLNGLYDKTSQMSSLNHQKISTQQNVIHPMTSGGWSVFPTCQVVYAEDGTQSFPRRHQRRMLHEVSQQRSRGNGTEVTFGWGGSIKVGAWRIVPVSKWLVTPIYKPFRPLIGGTTLLRGLTNRGY